MLSYQTIIESSRFKLSKVKNTTSEKSWYSIIYTIRSNETFTTYSQTVGELRAYFGKEGTVQHGNAVEWKFKSKKIATKHYNWIRLKWG